MQKRSRVLVVAAEWCGPKMADFVALFSLQIAHIKMTNLHIMQTHICIFFFHMRTLRTNNITPLNNRSVLTHEKVSPLVICLTLCF